MATSASEAFLLAIDSALDAAWADGRIKHVSGDPSVREMFRHIMDSGGPLHLPPKPPQPIQTTALVMDRRTLHRLMIACRFMPSPGQSFRMAEYCGVPIKVDDAADGHIYLVSLQPMQESR